MSLRVVSNLEARGVAKKIWLAIIYMDLAIVGGGGVSFDIIILV